MYKCLTLLILLTIVSAARSQSIVPKLDQEGRKGEMARLAKEKAARRFDAMDTDKDGRLSREEVAATSPYLGENFEKLDKNHDSFLSWEEFVGHNRWEK